jgi:hypothetical protein
MRALQVRRRPATPNCSRRVRWARSRAHGRRPMWLSMDAALSWNTASTRIRLSPGELQRYSGTLLTNTTGDASSSSKFGLSVRSTRIVGKLLVNARSWHGMVLGRSPGMSARYGTSDVGQELRRPQCRARGARRARSRVCNAARSLRSVLHSARDTGIAVISREAVSCRLRSIEAVIARRSLKGREPGIHGPGAAGYGFWVPRCARPWNDGADQAIPFPPVGRRTRRLA